MIGNILGSPFYVKRNSVKTNYVENAETYLKVMIVMMMMISCLIWETFSCQVCDDNQLETLDDDQQYLRYLIYPSVLHVNTSLFYDHWRWIRIVQSCSDLNILNQRRVIVLCNNRELFVTLFKISADHQTIFYLQNIDQSAA